MLPATIIHIMIRIYTSNAFFASNTSKIAAVHHFYRVSHLVFLPFLFLYSMLCVNDVKCSLFALSIGFTMFTLRSGSVSHLAEGKQHSVKYFSFNDWAVH